MYISIYKQLYCACNGLFDPLFLVRDLDKPIAASHSLPLLMHWV